MKCPKCNYVSHDYLDACRRCHEHLVVFKQQMGLFVLQPGMLDLSTVLGGRAHDEIFSTRLEDTGARTGVEDFDISLDDYAERPLMRAGSGTFIRPNRQEEGRNLQHLTLQIDASAMSAELPRSIARPQTESTQQPAHTGALPPPLPPTAPPHERADSPPAHLTLDYDSTSLHLASGSFLQPPGIENAPPPPLRTDHMVHPKVEPAEDEVSDSLAWSMEAPDQSAPSTKPLSPPTATPRHAQASPGESTDPILPSLDASTDDPRQRPLSNVSTLQETATAPAGSTQEETERLPLPTLAFLNPEAMSIDVDTNVRGASTDPATAPRRDSSSDGLAFGVAEQQTTEDALMFDIAEPLERMENTIPGPGEILPTGAIPRGTMAAPNRTQTSPDANPAGGLGETLNELTATDFGEEDLEFEFQELTDATHDDPGMLSDVHALQLERNTRPPATESTDTQSKQHESMPGHLTLELDAGAMSIELSPTPEETDRITASLSDSEKRSLESRPGAIEDTSERDTRPKAFKSGHVTLEFDTNTIQTQRPSIPGHVAESGRAQASHSPAPQAPQAASDADDLMLDLDGLDETPRQP